MKLGVLGAGAIGCYLGGRLVASGRKVVLVGRASLGQEVAAHNMRLSDYRGYARTLTPAEVAISTEPEALASCDVILLTVKSGDTEQAAATLARVAPSAVVVSFQNGIGNPDLLRAAGLRVCAGMVPFNVLRKEGARFHQGTSGTLVLDDAAAPASLVEALSVAGLPARARADVRAMQWGKLLVNLNNSINALAGVPIRQMLADRSYRLVMAACAREAIGVLAAAGVTARLDPPLPPRLVPSLLSLPDALFALFSRPMIRVDEQARSSMWDDLARGRRTEIDALNGEIVRLAESVGRDAPLNRCVVELVRAAEGHGSPGLSSRELSERVRLVSASSGRPSR